MGELPTCWVRPRPVEGNAKGADGVPDALSPCHALKAYSGKRRKGL